MAPLLLFTKTCLLLRILFVEATTKLFGEVLQATGKVLILFIEATTKLFDKVVRRSCSSNRQSTGTLPVRAVPLRTASRLGV